MKALEITDLKKTYGRSMQALKGINLTVEEGDFFGLLGPNGAGKSTLISIVTSLVRKTAGTVKVFGVDLHKHPAKAKSYIGVVPQEVNCNVFEKVIDIVMNQAGYYGVPRKVALTRAEKYLKLLHLWDKRHEASRSLSGGMKRRLMIARALMHEPRLLFLDEPTAGVDIEIRHSMWKFLESLNKEGVTIILTTHYLEEAEQLCRRIGIINHGEIIRVADTQHLIKELEQEHFIVELAAPVEYSPVFDSVEFKQLDEHTLELSKPAAIQMSEVFKSLNEQGVQVLTLRNKTNRLEELFVNLVE